MHSRAFLRNLFLYYGRPPPHNALVSNAPFSRICRLRCLCARPPCSVQYLLALAHGCWVVTHQWVEACLAAGQLVDEAAYEAKVGGMLCRQVGKQAMSGIGWK